MDEIVISLNENLLIIDNGCDQTILDLNSFLVQYFAGINFAIEGD